MHTQLGLEGGMARQAVGLSSLEPIAQLPIGSFEQIIQIVSMKV